MTVPLTESTTENASQKPVSATTSNSTWISLFLLAFLPFIIIMTTVLPNLWKYWSYDGASPKSPSIKSILNIKLTDAQSSEVVASGQVATFSDGTPAVSPILKSSLPTHGS